MAGSDMLVAICSYSCCMFGFFKYYLPLLSAVVLFFSCGEKHTGKELTVGYYYWKNKGLDADAVTALDTAGIRFLYAKIADIVWKERAKKAQPATKLSGLLPVGYDKKDMIVVPVVFIINEVMLRSDSTDILELAVQVKRYVHDWTELYNGSNMNELQVDCDWTAQSRDRYFYFLRELKRILPETALSITLRLYPYKYPGIMGIPPVDKVVLMCYNMGQIKEYREKNSILTVGTLQSYLVKKPYPLPLDLALPIYGWYVWYSNKEYKGILYENEYERLRPYIKEKDSIYHILTEDVATDFRYFRIGDEFRPEFPGEHDLDVSLSLLRQYFPEAERLLLFHWEERNFERYGALMRRLRAE